MALILSRKPNNYNKSKIIIDNRILFTLMNINDQKIDFRLSIPKDTKLALIMNRSNQSSFTVGIQDVFEKAVWDLKKSQQSRHNITSVKLSIGFNEKVILDDKISFFLKDVNEKEAIIGIDAPRDFNIRRAEIPEQNKRNKPKDPKTGNPAPHRA